MHRLEAEHRALAQALDMFDCFLAKGAAGDADPHDVPRVAAFFRDYVQLHHEREETLLLPAMAEHEFSTTRGPLVYIVEEHAKEGALLDELFAVAFRRGGCAPSDAAFAAAARAFIDFERAHMAKETQYLYPAAKQILVNDTTRLDARDARFDAEHEVYGRRSWAERVLGELSATYGVAAA